LKAANSTGGDAHNRCDLRTKVESMTYEPYTKNRVSGTRDQERAFTKARFEPSREGEGKLACAIEATGNPAFLASARLDNA
jgi:hypothetical protein